MSDARTAYLLVFLANASISLSALFIPLLARELGISYFQLGVVGMAYGLASFFSYSLFGRLSDISGRRKIFVQVGFAVSSTIFILQILMRDLSLMILIRGLAGFSIGVFSFPLLAYVSRLRSYRERVGWYAGFGSLGWFTGYMIAGLVSVPPFAFILAGLFFLFGFFFSPLLRKVKKPKIKSVPFLEILRRNHTLYLTYLLRHTGAYAVWIVFPLYLVDLGASIFWVGVVYAINSLTQFFVMGFLGRRVGKRGDKRLIRLGLFFSSVVFLLYFLATSFVQILPVQILLGFGWSSLYVGSLLHLLGRNVEKATSTGLLGSTISLAAVTGPLLGGIVSQLYGMRAVMLTACVLSLLALGFSKEIG